MFWKCYSKMFLTLLNHVCRIFQSAGKAWLMACNNWLISSIFCTHRSKLCTAETVSFGDASAIEEIELSITTETLQENLLQQMLGVWVRQGETRLYWEFSKCCSFVNGGEMSHAKRENVGVLGKPRESRCSCNAFPDRFNAVRNSHTQLYLQSFWGLSGPKQKMMVNQCFRGREQTNKQTYLQSYTRYGVLVYFAWCHFLFLQTSILCNKRSNMFTHHKFTWHPCPQHWSMLPSGIEITDPDHQGDIIILLEKKENSEIHRCTHLFFQRVLTETFRSLQVQAEASSYVFTVISSSASLQPIQNVNALTYIACIYACTCKY